jgi:hypothetical protein
VAGETLQTMKNTPMTEGIRLQLLHDTELKITEISEEIDGIRKLLKKAEDIEILFAKENKVIEFYNLINLMKYRLFIGLIILDLASASRIFINAKLKYEALYSARQIVIIIDEAFKKIYNFIKQNEKGDKIIKHRKNSFWIKNVGQIINQDLPQLIQQYNDLTNELEKYLSSNFKDVKEQRDLFIHYDEDPSNVYDALIKINIEETFKKMNAFLEILNRMYRFTENLVLNYKLKAMQENKSYEIPLDKMISELNEIKNASNMDDILLLKNNLQNIKKIIYKKM